MQGANSSLDAALYDAMLLRIVTACSGFVFTCPIALCRQPIRPFQKRRRLISLSRRQPPLFPS